ncbi:MBL fold metallo-hydrolase [Lachnoclostridium sp. Marseille-P6806]|uniref:MBL fold metallo-hydrolase n=1 Tax=Lachnoclostridium sp. Marseille-P6806 TaxID=2364793 RepID=UPI00102F79C1|nr:MBL fold metallo-hydrolase [Lachnoclostridium sp. Marseille-P6806]
MSKKATEFQRKAMSRSYRGKGIFKPLNTGWIDGRVCTVREWVANIFFYRKGGQLLMIDAGYNYDRLEEKMGWLDLKPSMVHEILITHQDTDHVGAVERDSPGLFRGAALYIGETENRYLTGEEKRRVLFHLYTLPPVVIDNRKSLLKDGDIFRIGDIKAEAILCPGHTKGHMVYLVDDSYLFTGDALWLGADGGYGFINGLADDIEEQSRSLFKLRSILRSRNLRPVICTGHTGWTDDFDFAFRHIDKACSVWKRKQKPIDPTAPFDGYDESDDTEEKARTIRLPKAYEAG